MNKADYALQRGRNPASLQPTRLLAYPPQDQGPEAEIALRMGAARATVEGVGMCTLRALRKVERMEAYLAKVPNLTPS
jgi:hypothetical protein